MTSKAHLFSTLTILGGFVVGAYLIQINAPGSGLLVICMGFLAGVVQCGLGNQK